jgi:hypothetical protein
MTKEINILGGRRMIVDIYRFKKELPLGWLDKDRRLTYNKRINMLGSRRRIVGSYATKDITSLVS